MIGYLEGVEFARGLFELNVNMIHTCGARTFLQPVYHLLEMISRPFQHGFNPSIRKVFYPAVHPYLSCINLGEMPEADTLNSTFNKYVCAFHEKLLMIEFQTLSLIS